MDIGLQKAVAAAPAFAGADGKIARAGTVAALSLHLGLTRSAACQWKKVPADRVVAVEAATGVPRAELRPDLYGAAPNSPAEAT